MVRPKKRQRAADDDSGPEAATAQLAVTTTKRAKTAKSKQAQSSGTEPQDLLKKLPGEIRNMIYEFALGHQDDDRRNVSKQFHVRCRASRYGECGHCGGGRRLKEPGLLLAAKWIRAEAKTFFYEYKRFQITLRSSEFEAARDWLRNVLIPNQQDNTYFAPNFRIRKSNWDDLHGWLPLAQLFHEFDFNFTVDRYVRPITREDAWGTYVTHRYSSLWSQHYPCSVIRAETDIAAVMNQVVAPGLKAREEDWHADLLEIEFEQWVERVIDSQMSHELKLATRLERSAGAKHRKLMQKRDFGRVWGPEMQRKKAIADGYCFRGYSGGARRRLTMDLRSRKADSS